MNRGSIKRVLALVIAFAMTLAILPTAALATSGTSVTITSAAVLEGSTDQATIAFTCPNDTDTDVTNFIVKVWYTYTVNGNDYIIDRRSRPIATNPAGSYTCTMTVPTNIDPTGAYQLYASVVTTYTDGTITQSDGVPLTATPQRQVSDTHQNLIVTIPANPEQSVDAATYTYAYNAENPSEPANTFVSNSNGISFDAGSRTLTLSGDTHGATVSLSTLPSGYDVNTLVLNGATFGEIAIIGHKPLEIQLLGDSTGNIKIDNNSDLFITAHAGADTTVPSLTGTIISHGTSGGSDNSNVVMSNIQYTAVSDGNAAAAFGAAAFDHCIVSITQSSGASEAMRISDFYSSGNSLTCTRINDAGLIVRDCTQFNAASTGSVISAKNGGVVFDGSTATLTHNNGTTTGLMDASGINGTNGSGIPLTVKNNSTLNINITQNSGCNTYGCYVGSLAVDTDSKVIVHMTAPTGGVETRQYGIRRVVHENTRS